MKTLKNRIKSMPIFEFFLNTYSNIKGIQANNLFVPPGHFYSPIPSIKEIEKYQDKLFTEPTSTLEGITLNETSQLSFLNTLKHFYDELPPYKPTKQEGLRYYYDNSEYKYSDAILLFCMIRHLKPHRIIEVGSGYSTCLMIDTNELFFNHSIDISCIDPYPQRLIANLNHSDREKVRINQCLLQDVDLNEFKKLSPNDILFIDSTHVCKTNSDVNRIMFEILPSLASGVFIHFHDIFYPFEYPKKWVYEGRAWNEAYFLRAFLQYNTTFEIVLMNTFMEYFYEDFFRQNFPLCMKAKGGSIWIKKNETSLEIR